MKHSPSETKSLNWSRNSPTSPELAGLQPRSQERATGVYHKAV